MASNPSDGSFRALFAKQYGVSPDRFEAEVFVLCVPWIYRPVARILVKLVPPWFHLDLQVLSDMAKAESLQEVRILAGDFRDDIRHRASFVRDSLGFRASGRRLMGLAKQVFPRSGANQT